MRWQLQIAYDGTDFSGCPELPDERTICGELRRALERADLGPGLVETLSRTDAGVHARRNLAHLELSREIEPKRLLGVLSRHLPADLRANRAMIIDAPPEVVDKTYRYTLDLHPFGDPALARTSWRLPGPVDVEVLAGLGERLVGEHDFEAFRRRGETRASLVRTFHEARWVFVQDRAQFYVRGPRFSYQLVRAVVGAMVMVARGGVSVDAFDAALGGITAGVARQTAPAKGLCLYKIRARKRWMEDLCG